ncbi:MAG: RNase III inhibitor, partial [Thermoplasmata archaeon]
LSAKYVIHTVGPIYSRANRERNAELLRRCYENSLKLAAKHGIKSISFPAISTGIYGYPVGEAAEIAVKAIVDFMKEHDEIELVRMVLYDMAAFEAHRRAMEQII